MVRVECKPHCRWLLFSILSGLLLAGSICRVARAQDEGTVCPCFSYEEVEGVFLTAEKLIASGGGGSCRVSDYGVEFKGEVVVNDENYKTVARASVSWADFDPGRCQYRDTAADPAVERRETWPHPAPEGIARACLDIIASVIEEQDSSGRCSTYP